jgi:phage host-nuclease inhibitor protein Gam
MEDDHKEEIKCMEAMLGGGIKRMEGRLKEESSERKKVEENYRKDMKTMKGLVEGLQNKIDEDCKKDMNRMEELLAEERA